MVKVSFTPNLLRHVNCREQSVAATTVQEALDRVFQDQPDIQGYVLDDQGRLRTHMAVFIDGKPILDRDMLSDAVSENSEIYVMQALSGG